MINNIWGEKIMIDMGLINGFKTLFILNYNRGEFLCLTQN